MGRHGPRWGLAAWIGLAAAAQAQPATNAPTVNTGALDALKPAPRTRPAAPHATTPPPPARKPAVRPANAPATPLPPRPPAVPVAPPAIAAIPPAVAVPVQPTPPPPAVPTAADAPGEASPVPGGVRATFGADRSDLNPVTEAAIRAFAHPLVAGDKPVNVLAYAAGSADDPSTPRRLALARALAARAVLINEGIPSTRIWVRALGPAGGGGPADRVDVSVDAPGAKP